MDHVFVVRILQLVADNVAVMQRVHCRSSDGSQRNDLCDLDAARVYADALLASGMSKAEMAAEGEIFVLASDVMNHHRGTIAFAEVNDRLAWSYTSLYVRMVALAFLEHSEVGAGDAMTIDTDRPLHRPPPRALDTLASQVSREAIDRLDHAVRCTLPSAATLRDTSPFSERSRTLVEAWASD